MNFHTWLDRPKEIKTHFNPMFCSIVLSGALGSYQKEKGIGMPIPLSFLVLPLVLHSKTRSSLPKMKASNMGLWSSEKESELLLLNKRIESLNRPTFMSISFLNINDVISIAEGRIIFKKNIRGINSYINLTPEVYEIFLKSQFVGRWFANSGEVSTIYTYLGVRP